MQNYDGATRFKAEAWDQQIRLRMSYAEYRADILSSLSPQQVDEVRKAWYLFMQAPVNMQSAKTLLPETILNRTICGSWEERHPGVRLPSAADYYRLEADISEDFREYARTRPGADSAAVLFSKSPDGWDNSLDWPPGRTVFPVLVDLSQPTQILVEQFKGLISKTKRSIVFKNRRSSWSTWAEMALLPCLDLLLWREDQAEKPTMRNIAAAIYSGDLNQQETFRGPTARMAQSLLDQSFDLYRDVKARQRYLLRESVLRQLAADIAHERLEAEEAKHKLRSKVGKKPI